MMQHIAIALFLAATVSANLALDVTSDERRVIDLGTFGYSEGGKFQLALSSFFISESDGKAFPDKTSASVGHHNESMGFVLDRVRSKEAARYERSYAKQDATQKHLCFIDDAELQPPKAAERFSFRLDTIKFAELYKGKVFDPVTITLPGLYALFFYNCKGFRESGKLTTIPISFSVTATQYNGNDGSRNYLSVGDQPLPTTFTFFTLCFAGLLAVWVKLLRAEAQYVHRIHYVMLFLIAVKCLSLFFEALKYSHYASTGTASAWDFFYYVFLTAKGVTLFAVLVLLGSGWSFLKAFLSDQDKRLMVVVVPCQVVINICIAIVEETNEGSSSWGNWVDLLRLLDVVCCCVVLLPIVWSIQNLRTASDLDEKAAQSLSRMRLFRTFYIVVVAYIYFTRIIVVMIEASLPFDVIWSAKVLTELCALAFYAFAGYKFRPMKENPYLHLNQEDLDELKNRQELAEINDGSAA
jgi:hypothetical protein